MELTKRFTADQYARGLAAWSWLELDDKTPRFSSAIGDVFFEASDGGWWYLDVLSGSLDRPWADADALHAELAGAEGRNEYLMAGLVEAADAAGLHLDALQVYTFAPPPVLGGALDVAHMQVLDVVSALDVAGQIHRKVRSLPASAHVAGLTVW